MKMPYWSRIAVGVALGLVALVALWRTLGIAWLTALVATLMALVGFLGSYFVVSADRPEQGYEQVLFDRPNTVVTVLLLVVFAGAGVGTGFLGATSAPPSTADGVLLLYAGYQRASDAYLAAEDGEAAEEELAARLDELRVESDRLAIDIDALPEGDERDALLKANDFLAFAMDSLKACAGGDDAECQSARFHAADAQSALMAAGVV